MTSPLKSSEPGDEARPPRLMTPVQHPFALTPLTFALLLGELALVGRISHRDPHAASALPAERRSGRAHLRLMPEAYQTRSEHSVAGQQHRLLDGDAHALEPPASAAGCT